MELDRDPLDDVSGDSFLATVVEAGGARIGMAGEVLNVFQRDALGKHVSDRRDAEGVG